MKKCDENHNLRKYVLLFLCIVCYVILKCLGLIFFFNADLSQFKNWYPDFFVLVYLLVKSIFPLFFSSFIVEEDPVCLINKSKKNIAVYSLLFIFFLVIGLNCKIQISFILVLSGIFLYRIYVHRLSIKNFILFILTVKHSLFFQIFTWLLIIVAIGVRIGFGLWAENSGHGDASCRFSIAQIWSDYYLGSASTDLIINPNIDWLPLHFYITGIIWKLTKSIRVIIFVHSIVGVLTAFLVYKTTKLFADIEISLVAALCYLCYPASVTPAIFVAFYSFIRIIQRNELKYYATYFFAMSSATLLRYEVWPMLVVMPFIHLAYTQGRLYKGFVVHILVMIVPISITGLIYYQGFHPLRGIMYSDAQVAYCYNKTGRTIKVLFDGYKSAIVPGIFTFSLFALYFYKSKTYFVLYAILCLMFISPFLYKVATFTIVPHERYLSKYIVLFLPLFTIGFCTLVCKILKRSSILVKLLSTAMMLFGVLFGYQYTNFYGYRLPDGFNNSVAFVNRVESGNFIVDHHRALRGYTWMALTELPLLLDYKDNYLNQFIDFNTVKKTVFKNNKSNRAIKYIVNDYDHEFNTIDFNLVNDLIRENENIYIVLFPEGNLNPVFSFKGEIETYQGLGFKRVFMDNGYLIYKKI
jgi:hypothetical protein